VQAILPLQIGGGRQHPLLVFDDRLDHLHDRCPWGVESAALLQIIDDLRPAVTSALHQARDLFGREQLRNGNTVHCGIAWHRHHGVPVAAQDEPVHVFHRHAEFLRNKVAKTRRIQHSGHAHDTLFGPAADLLGDVDHGIQRIRDHDHVRVG
jgi:hypothetical protein